MASGSWPARVLKEGRGPLLTCEKASGGSGQGNRDFCFGHVKVMMLNTHDKSWELLILQGSCWTRSPGDRVWTEKLED